MSNKQTIDVLERLWAAIGDRLLAKGPLDQAYAHAVMRECTDEVARLKEQDAAPATMSPSAFKAVQEACAKACEKGPHVSLASQEYTDGFVRGMDHCAAAIRSVAPSSIPGLTVAGESGEDDARDAALYRWMRDDCRGYQLRKLTPDGWREIPHAEWDNEIQEALTTTPGKEER